jgi:hypothetical protein
MIPFNLLLPLDMNPLEMDLYRMGNASWPGFSQDRAMVDLKIDILNGVEIVRANGNGFSASTKITEFMKRPGKKIWLIGAGIKIDGKIQVVKDMRIGHDGHYMFAPIQDMPLMEYLKIMAEMCLDKVHCRLLSQQEVLSAR